MEVARFACGCAIGGAASNATSAARGEIVRTTRDSSSEAAIAVAAAEVLIGCIALLIFVVAVAVVIAVAAVVSMKIEEGGTVILGRINDGDTIIEGGGEGDGPIII